MKSRHARRKSAAATIKRLASSATSSEIKAAASVSILAFSGSDGAERHLSRDQVLELVRAGLVLGTYRKWQRGRA